MSNIKQENIHILIVDDSIINQEIISDFIEHLGFSLDTADNGLQAVEAVKLKTYSLICMDLHMPVMDGLAAARSIREYETSLDLKPVPIIALTADTASGIKQRCLEAGMNDYLAKPFSQQEILQKIKLYINDESLGNQQSTTSPVVNETNENPLLHAVEDIAQVSHWFWHFLDQRIQFSKYLQHHFDFPLRNITTLDDYINKVGSDSMNTVISECITSKHETRWEQKIIEPGVEQPKYLLHRFRFVVCEDDNPVLIGTIQDITSIRQAEKHVMELTSYDSVTGLSSRFRFNQQLEDLIQYNHRHAQKFAVLYLTLDTFKEINDRYGHQAGDKLLVEIASRLQKILRKSDFACRLVDDEFCLAIRDISDDVTVIRIAQRYLKLFEQPITFADQKIAPLASIGMAIYPQDGVKATALIRAANAAVDKAKSTCGHQFAFYENAKTDAARHRLIKENELCAALGKNQFELYYQPKVSLYSGEVAGVEAIIRWHHPDHTLHLPEDFLAEAEHMGLMADIGRWVIQQACDQIKAWREQGLDDISIAVNIAQQHFEQPDFADSVLKIVNDAGIPPSFIDIEITESISCDQKVFTDTCKQLRASGFKTVIDDFGTGYSSIAALKDIPIDILKIDREFIRDLPNNTQSSIIIGTILGISNALGLEVVAEGVENSEQLKTLVAMGCHMAQGLYFSPPVPATEIPALKKHNFRKPSLHRVA
jgi:diguanylate cyclase (GGDEF)-like protein